MTKSNKKRAGLQKKVSSVFKGVPIPGSKHKDRSDRMPSPQRGAASELPKPSDSQTCQDPVITRLDQPAESVDRTVPAHFTASLPSTSANHESSQSPAVGKLDQSEDSADKTVSERLATSPKPGPAERQSSQSSLIRRMAECEETSREPAPVARTMESSHKHAPAEQPQSNPLAETGGLGLGQQIRDKLATSKLGTGTAKDKVMVMLVPILAIAMIFMFRQVLRKSPGKAKGAATDDASAVAANAGGEIEWELPDPMPATMRDPIKLPSQDDTQSPGSDNTQKPEQDGATSETQTTAMRIRGLVYSEDKPSAVIGDRIVYVGDKINGVTIAGINRDSVEFEKDGETWVQKVRD